MTPTSQPPAATSEPIILPRAEHSLSRRQISENTLKVLYRLARNGHKAYLVGGGVRDLLLGRQPKDFDVGTDATPEQIRKLFRNAFLIGRRFRLAHIRFAGNELIEVATFRREATLDDQPAEGDDEAHFSANLFGTPAQDAFRRDFSINALFYDIETFEIIDYVGGLEDLKQRRLRVIGDPLLRFAEDPVRMLRALEFAARLQFTLDPSIREAIQSRAPLLMEAAPARLREELLELLRHKVLGEVLSNAQGMGLLTHLIPGYRLTQVTLQLLDRLDRRTASGQVPTEYLLLAVMYLEKFFRECPPEQDALTLADAVKLAGKVLTPHGAYFHIAQGVRHQARELLIGCFRLARGPQRKGQLRYLRNPAFQPALELFRFWCEARGEGLPLADEWQQKAAAPAGAPAPDAGRPRRRRRPRRRPRQV
jgi:poly(A) polymerase